MLSVSLDKVKDCIRVMYQCHVYRFLEDPIMKLTYTLIILKRSMIKMAGGDINYLSFNFWGILYVILSTINLNHATQKIELHEVVDCQSCWKLI